MAGATPAQSESPSKAAFTRGFNIFTPLKSSLTPLHPMESQYAPSPSASLQKVIEGLDNVLDTNLQPNIVESPESPVREIADVISEQSMNASVEDEARRRSSGLNADGSRPLTTGFNKAHQAEMGQAELEYINLLKQKTRNTQYKDEIESLKRKLRTIATQQELAQSAFEKIESEIQTQVRIHTKNHCDILSHRIPASGVGDSSVYG
jgi:hypothetical protein